MLNKTDRPLLEAVLENAEALVDSLINDEFLKDIPVVGTAIKLCSAVDSLRDRAFAAKLHKFVLGLGNNHSAVAVKWRQLVDKSPEDAKRVGETLFMVLERLSDLEKAELLASVFRAHVDDIIASQDLRRLAQAIDMAFMDDLKRLLELDRHPEKSAEPWLRYLAPTGLTIMVGGKTAKDVGDVYYEVSRLGGQLRNAYFHGRRKVKAKGLS